MLAPYLNLPTINTREVSSVRCLMHLGDQFAETRDFRLNSQSRFFTLLSSTTEYTTKLWILCSIDETVKPSLLSVTITLKYLGLNRMGIGPVLFVSFTYCMCISPLIIVC